MSQEGGRILSIVHKLLWYENRILLFVLGIPCCLADTFTQSPKTVLCVWSAMECSRSRGNLTGKNT